MLQLGHSFGLSYRMSKNKKRKLEDWQQGVLLSK